MAPYNIKHAMVDPSHTFLASPKKRKPIDLMNYCLKGDKQKDTRYLQHKRRETVDCGSGNVLRLPELRDFDWSHDVDPVTRYYKTKKDNAEFFRKTSEEKINLSDYAKANHLVSPPAGLGITKFKSSQAYLSDKGGRVFSEEPRKYKSP